MKRQNPFLLSKFISSKYICDRQKETERLVGAITNNRNIILFSHKGIGKTTLIFNTFYELKDLDNYLSIYLNFSLIENISDIITVFINALVFNNLTTGKKQNQIKFFLDKIVIYETFDSLTKHKSFRLNTKDEKIIFQYLAKIFDFLNLYNKKITIAFDDFENIIDNLEISTINYLVSLVNKSKNISFVFSTNNIKKLEPFWITNNQPNSNIELLTLEHIDKEKHKTFIVKHFNKKGIRINDKGINFLFDWCKLNTYCIQKACNILYKRNKKTIKLKYLKEVLNNILETKTPHYLIYKKLLSNYQWKLLRAIANEGQATNITSKLFINNYLLNAPSSVKTAVISLIDKNLVYRNNKTYQINDVFFEKWLCSNKNKL